MIELKNISKSFGKKNILDQINFTIEPGQITYLVGNNGSGKTTIMNIIMQLIPHRQGQILLDGQKLTRDDYQRIYYIPDQIVTLNSMTIQQSLDYMQHYYKSFNPKKASEILEFFKLNASDRINQLSKGNVAKVNILHGLCLDTDYLLMDEPFSGIDVFTREEIVAVFSSKLIEGQGVLISSHDINEIELMVDKAIVLKDGSIHSQVSPETLREQGQSLLDYMREVYQ